jgi:hypothetical protein
MTSYRPTLRNTATVLVSLLFVAWFIYLIPNVGSDFLLPILNLPVWLVWFVFIGLLLTYVLRGWRVAFEFRDHPKITLLNSIQIVLWHNASVNAMPLRSGELAFPLLLQRIAGVAMVRSTASLIHFRIQDASVVFMLCILLLPELAIALKVGLLFLALMIGLIFFWWLRQTNNWHASPNHFKRKLASFRDAMLHANSKAAWSWLLTICNWTIKIAVQAALYVHFVNIAFESGVMAAVGSEVAAFSPVQGVAGLGTFEVSSALVIYAQGVSWSEGLQAAAHVHLVLLFSAFFWALIGWIVSRLTNKKTNDEIQTT